MTLAATMLDPVLGLDIHIELVPAPPGPPVPTPIPNPFVGIVFDPIGTIAGLLIQNAWAAVTGGAQSGPAVIGVLPIANTGTECEGFGHILIPPGVSWAVPPANDATIVTGSETVTAMGSSLSRGLDLAMSCSEPVRLPTSIVMALPKGNPVLVGGPPSMDYMAAASAFIRTRWMSNRIHGLVERLVPRRLRGLAHWTACVLTGHPVDVATGRVLTKAVDVELPGPLPLRLERNYSSAFASRPSPVGHGWAHTLDQRVWVERGRVVYLAEDGRELELDTLALHDHVLRAGESVFDPIHRLTLKCLPEGRWEVQSSDGIVRELGPVPGGDPNVARLISMRSRGGHHRVQLHYDELGNLAWVRDSAGRRIRLEHDTAGRLIRLLLPVPDGEGHYEHRRYHYDSNGDLIGVTDAMNKSFQYEYATHLLTRETDRTGLSFYFGYDGIGEDAWCVRTWGDGGVYDHEILYDKVGKVTAVTNSLGETTLYRMNEVNLVVEKADPHGAVTRYEHDELTLQRTAEVDPLGRATRTAYDARGNATRIESADGAVVRLGYHEAFDLPVLAVDPNGEEWRWEYDSFGQLTGRQSPLGHWTRYEHMEGLLRKMSTPGGAVTTLAHDAERNVARIVTPLGGELRLEHDRLGRAIKLVNPRGGVERRTYDANDNVVRVEAAHGVVRAFDYDAEGNLLRARDGLRDVSFTYTGYHQLHERHEAGTTIRFHLDTEDRLRAVENEAGERYEFELDGRGHVSVERGFDGFAREYERDLAGQVTKITKASGGTTELRYDAAGRVTEVLHSDGSFERYAYRADGALIEASNDAAQVLFERDELGRVVREVTRTRDGHETWLRSGYDADGNRVRAQSSDGFVQHIRRDAAGDAVEVELEQGGSPWAVHFERDPVGLELARSFPNGVTSRWTRDLVGRPLRRTVTSRGDTTLNDKRYQWEGDDQIRAILDDRLGHAHYKHDARGRLVWAHLPWGEEQHRAVDAVGNLYRSPDYADRKYGRGGRILEADGTTYAHDDDGNLIRKTDVMGESTHYRWNGAGMLREVELPTGRLVRFEYDVLARRVKKEVLEREGDELRPAKEVRWSWDGHVPVVELDSEAGKTTWAFEPETFNPLAKLARGQVWGVLTDQIGTPTELVAADGSVIEQELDTYGTTRTQHRDQIPPFRWPGQYEDAETGLTFNRWRYFDSTLGHFVTQDPARLVGGILPFGYALDPLAEVDPLGLARKKCGSGQSSRNERLDRFTNAAEAEATEAAGGLVPRPGHTGPKRVMVPVTEADEAVRVAGRLGGRKQYSHHVQLEVEPGTTRWLRENGMRFEDGVDNVRFEIPPDRLDEFNQKVVSVSAQRIR